MLKIGAEQDKKEDIGCTDSDTNAEDPLATPNHMIEDSFHAEPNVSKFSGNKFSKKVKQEKHQTEDSQVLAGASASFKDKEHGNSCYHKVEWQ